MGGPIIYTGWQGGSQAERNYRKRDPAISQKELTSKPDVYGWKLVEILGGATVAAGVLPFLKKKKEPTIT